MTGSLRHRRRRPAPQSGTPNAEVAQEKNNDSVNGPTIKKKKGRTSTKLKRPPNGACIAITPMSDLHFEGDDGIAGQVSALLKLEYPSIIKEKNGAGVETKRHASEWEDYCIVEEPEQGSEEIRESAADRLKAEFWSIYQLQNDTPEERLEADRVLGNLARKQLKQVLYQARKDAVKKYYNEIIDEPIKDSDACRKELTKSQYIEAKLDWCKDVEAWESLSDYWCSSEYKEKQKLGRYSRTISEEIAQNRGGSRNFIRSRSYIAKTFGPEQATNMNTYKLMKVGAKKYKETGSSTSIDNPKAKKRVEDYYDGLKEAYPEDWEERDLDPKIMYSTGGGMPHGRLSIGDGAIRKAEVVAAAKQHDIRPSNSLSYQALLRRNQQLEKKYKKVEKKYKKVDIMAKHMKVLFANAGIPMPEDLSESDDSMDDADAVDISSPSHCQGGTLLTGSSHAGEHSRSIQSDQPAALSPQPTHSPNTEDVQA